MLDEKGRLFGKINIVDLLIVVVIIAAVAFVGIKYVLPKDAGPTDEIEIQVYIDNTYRFVADQLVEGASVYDGTDKVNMGVCTGWEVHPYYEAVALADSANPPMREVEEKCTLDLTLNVMGSMGEHGATIDGYLLGNGHTMILYVGDCKVFGAVRSIKLVK
ncbi:MAG: DUF4330 family protein [Bacillota bacterium]|nr:DUF4330 family protein [Bacillota bacterium]